MIENTGMSNKEKALVTCRHYFLFSKQVTLFLFFISYSLIAAAQIFPAKNYPKDYFTYPVGATVALSANYGELRPNHYHMGLDCRTNQRENLPIYAAAEGYIARVKIEPYGFGRAIYINHPNGFTTLYAHLNDFFPELEAYVKSEQYRLSSWNVFLDIPPSMFPVTKKQFIAFSGNTGGSQGPHLHFEIRDTKTDKVLNPLLFGFPLPDNVPPAVSRVALYDRNISTYEQTPRFITLSRSAGAYVHPAVITANSDKISFAISATDRLSGSANPNGIYEAIIYFDEEAVSGFQLDNIGYDETRYLNAHIDHKLKLNGGPYVQHLSRLAGYPQGVYKDIKSDGVIMLTDDSVHNVRIEVKDSYGNTSLVRLKVKRGIVGSGKKYGTTGLYEGQSFHPGFVNVFEKEDIQVTLSQRDLYDSTRFTYSKIPAGMLGKFAGDIHRVHTAAVPVHGFFRIRIKPGFIVPAHLENCMIIQRKWGGKMDVAKAKKEGEWYEARFRNFGDFQLMADTIPPTITAVGIKENANLARAGSISFVVKDNSDEFKNFRAELDGKWLRFTNDKGRKFTYKFDEHCLPGQHELKVRIEDEAGNETSKVFRFSR